MAAVPAGDRIVGHEEEWVHPDQLPDPCPICQLVPRDAVAHDCGQPICASCWDAWMAADGRSCPWCRGECDGNAAPQHFFRRQVLSLELRCQACGDIFRLRAKPEHLEACRVRRLLNRERELNAREERLAQQEGYLAARLRQREEALELLEGQRASLAQQEMDLNNRLQQHEEGLKLLEGQRASHEEALQLLEGRRASLAQQEGDLRRREEQTATGQRDLTARGQALCQRETESEQDFTTRELALRQREEQVEKECISLMKREDELRQHAEGPHSGTARGSTDPPMTNVDAVDANGRTALHRAARDGQEEVVTQLLSARADVGKSDRAGNTALHTAALMGHQQVVEQLLSAKADATKANNFGKTALDRAADGREQQVVAQLRAAGGRGGFS